MREPCEGKQCFTYSKSLQKITESLQVNKDTKIIIKSMEQRYETKVII